MNFIAPVQTETHPRAMTSYAVDVSLTNEDFDVQDLIDVKLQQYDCDRYAIFDEVHEHWIGDVVYDPARGILVLAYADRQLPVETAQELGHNMEQWMLESLPISEIAIGTMVVSVDAESERYVRAGKQPGLVRASELRDIGERIDLALHELTGEPYMRLMVYLRAHYMRGMRGAPREVTLPWELASEFLEMKVA